MPMGSVVLDKLKLAKGPRTRPDLQKINKPTTAHGKGSFFAAGGVTRADGCITKGHTRGKVV